MPRYRTTELQTAYNEWLRRLGENIAARRNELGLTQAQAAYRCDLDYKFYQDLEYGRRPISTRSLFYLANAIEISVADLVPTD